MKRYLYLYIVALLSLVATSCTHKELCEDARRYHINIHADYRLDWEDTYEEDWKSPGQWPDHFMPYNDLKPKAPSGLIVYDYQNGKANYLGYTVGSEGLIRLSSENNNLLIYNSDTEYNVVTYESSGALVRATTRTKTRASFTGNKYANENEETKKSPDLLFVNYYENYHAERTLDPVDFTITLQPLVFTYYIRIPIKEGLEFVRRVGHTGDLSGMADGVNMLTGETLDRAITILFDNAEDYDIDCITVTDWGIEAIVRSYGLPGYPHANYPTRSSKNGLGINIYLTNGKIARFECDVTDQISRQPHGGVIEFTEDIIIEKEAGEEGSGAFEVDVDKWETEDIVLPLN